MDPFLLDENQRSPQSSPANASIAYGLVCWQKSICAGEKVIMPAAQYSGESAVKRSADVENQQNARQSECRRHGSRRQIAVAEEFNPPAQNQR